MFSSYSRALFLRMEESSLSLEQQNQLLEELKGIQVWLDQSEAQLFFSNPRILMPRKKEVLRQILEKGACLPLTRLFLELVLKNKKLFFLQSIIEEVKAFRLARQGILWGRIWTAHPLSSEEVNQLTRLWEKKWQKKIQFEVLSRPSLIAGIQVTLEGVTYSGSLSSQLQSLKESFLFMRRAH